MTPDEVYRLALELYGDPVEARVAAAQAQLETGGGASAPGHNLFGIKGPGGTYATTEVIDGQPVRTHASFRGYPDYRSSIEDRLRFLRENPRYANAGYFEATTPEAKADALQRAGYATDPRYADKLKRIMNSGDGLMLRPVATPAQPMASPGLLGGQTPTSLLGPTQPQSLLDRFAPGSGYGYDLAVGIANTPGGPMTALAGGMANAKDKAFERSMLAARGKVGGMPSKTQEVLNLMAMGVPQEQAMRMAYPGGSEHGVERREIGGVTYDIYTSPAGVTRIEEIPSAEQARRQDILGAEAGAEAAGKGYGEMEVKMVDEVGTRLPELTSMLSSAQSLLRRMETGEFGTAGPIEGRLRQAYDVELAELNLLNMQMALMNLTEANLAPISNEEIRMIRDLYAGAYRTPEQNKRVLRVLTRQMQARVRWLDRLRRMLVEGVPIKTIRLAVPDELGEIEYISPEAGAATPSPVTEPAGFDAEFDAIMQEFR